jgi:quercetin dioxygenase-like cupin family protein
MTQPYVAQQVDHQQLEWIGGSTLSVLLDAGTTGGQLTMMTSDLTKGDGAPVHVHSAEDELMLIIEGAGTFWVGNDRHRVGEGGVVWLPRGLPHTYRIDSPTARMLTVCTPGGLEGFFRQAGRDRATPKPDGWVLTPQTMGAALAAHGGTILGPPKGAED